MNTELIFSILSFFPVICAIAKILEVNGYAINSYIANLSSSDKQKTPLAGCAGLSLIFSLWFFGFGAILWKFAAYLHYEHFIFLLAVVQQLVFFVAGLLYIPAKVDKSISNPVHLKKVKRFTVLNGMLQLSLTIYGIASL